MLSRSWQDVDQAHLLQKIILLQLLNNTPEKPSGMCVSEWSAPTDYFTQRVLSLQREKELAESFAFLAATTNDPRKIVAACVEEGELGKCLTIRLAVNNGGLDNVRTGFQKLARALERIPRAGSMAEQGRVKQEQHAILCEAITLNQNRILVRLRSRHATFRCNFKKDKSQRPKVISQLYTAVNDQASAENSGVAAPVFAALKADIETLHELFTRLESLTTPKAKCSPGLEILIPILIACQRVHTQGILHQVLTRSSRLDPGSRRNIAITITKLSRYVSISRFLLQAARKYSVFDRIQISVINSRVRRLPALKLDSMTAGVIDNLLEESKRGVLSSKLHAESPSAIKDHICQAATLAVPVHAEIQLLFHYERSPSNSPPRIICSSKQACFLCNLFFKMHGRFMVPSTHGRLYEKWALPAAVENTRDNVNEDILTTIRSFVSAVDDALIREMRSTRGPYPNPYESMILLSAACSQSNESAAAIRGPMDRALLGKGSLRSGVSIPILNADNRTQTNLPILHTIETQAQTECMDPAFHSHSKSSGPSSVTSIRAPSSLKALSKQFVTSRGTVKNHTPSCFPLEKGRPVWRELTSASQSFEVSTPRIHLTISYDETLSNRQNLIACLDCYWVILEFLSDHFVPRGRTVPVVSLLEMSGEPERMLDYGNADWPRELCVRSDYDVIAITYSLQKPTEGERR